MPDTPSGWKIEKVMSAWQSERARLLTDDADLAHDEEALTELLGPEQGDVRDILARLLRGAAHAKSMAEGADDRLTQITARRDRYRRRAEGLRGTVSAIMEVLGEKRIELPDVTASISQGRASVVVTNEAALADRFVRITRAPNKAALKEAMEDGEVVEGAEWRNGAPTLNIRTR